MSKMLYTVYYYGFFKVFFFVQALQVTHELRFFRGSRQHYGRLNEYEPEPYMDSDIQEEEDEEDVPGKC